MFFFISYYTIRSFFGGTYWIISKSYQGIYYLLQNRKMIQNKIKDTTHYLLKDIKNKDL